APPVGGPPPAGGGAARRRGEPELHLSPARAASRRGDGPERPADRAPARPRRTRLLALPARGQARPGAAVVRGRARRRGRASARRGRADGRRPVLLQRGVVELHVPLTRALRRAARAVVRGLPAGAAARRFLGRP